MISTMTTPYERKRSLHGADFPNSVARCSLTTYNGTTYFSTLPPFPLTPKSNSSEFPLSIFFRSPTRPKAKSPQELITPPYLDLEEAMPSLSQTVPPTDLQFIIQDEISKGLTQSAIISHWLNQYNIPFPDAVTTNASGLSLRDAIIIGLDAEWYEHDSNYITELGLSILEPRFINTKAADSPWSVAKGLMNHHVRIKENAHMMNSELCTGYPEHFQFGETSYTSVSEAKNMLLSIFQKTDHRGCPRPVIFLGHAISNDYEVIRDRFDLDLASLGVIVATIDTQVLALEQGLAPAGRAIKLKDLLGAFSLEEPYLHNAGNDIVATMLSALLMGSPQPVTPIHPTTAYRDLKTYLQTTNKHSYGQPRFCPRCDSNLHTQKFCCVKVCCSYCSAEPAPVQPADTHTVEKCLELVKERVFREKGVLRSRGSGSPLKRFAVPCEYCIMSEDPDRYRAEFAYAHESGECIWGTVGAVEK